MNGALCLSITGFSCYFSFSRISSALMPPANNFLTTLSASAFFASSAALASAFAFFASRDATSFSAFFRADFFSFSVFFCYSIAFWMDAISVFRDVIVSCFSVIWDATSDLGRFLLPFVLAIRCKPHFYNKNHLTFIIISLFESK